MAGSVEEHFKRWDIHAQKNSFPFETVIYEDAKAALARIQPQFERDKESSTREFAAQGALRARAGADAEAKGDTATARRNYLGAYGLYRLARYPCILNADKRAAYGKAKECLYKAYALSGTPIRVVEIPFTGRAGEGDKVVGYLRVPPGAARAPAMVAWAGIDSYKEEWMVRCDPFFARGIASLTIDMPGTGDSPLLYGENAERQWDAVFDWIATQPNLDSNRIGAWGGSDGGYWATKIAHTHRERLKAVISQGGGAHILFSPEWIAKAQSFGNPWGIAETRGNAAGKPNYDEWVKMAPRMSLLTQGVLDKKCAPLLCINGVKDPITPIEDYYIVLQHGGPKWARFFPGGHMGMDAQGDQSATVPVMVNWMCERLGISARPGGTA
jgi:pimeloyl-ACP methyl ester carboxylesterase